LIGSAVFTEIMIVTDQRTVCKNKPHLHSIAMWHKNATRNYHSDATLMTKINFRTFLQPKLKILGL